MVGALLVLFKGVNLEGLKIYRKFACELQNLLKEEDPLHVPNVGILEGFHDIVDHLGDLRSQFFGRVDLDVLRKPALLDLVHVSQMLQSVLEFLNSLILEFFGLRELLLNFQEALVDLLFHIFDDFLECFI